MATPLATLADIESTGYEPASTAVEQKLEYLLRMGSALLRSRFLTIDARIANGTLDEQLVKDVLVGMVLRTPSAGNTDTIRSESVSDDTYSVTYVTSTGSGEDEIGITAQEVALLAVPTLEPALPYGTARLRAMLS